MPQSSARLMIASDLAFGVAINFNLLKKFFLPPA
jgi:hypothetical protein